MRRALFLACLSLFVGCDPGVFGDLESGASTHVLDSPGGFREGAFGLRIASIRAPFGTGIEATRVAAAGGTGSGFGIYSMWTGAMLDMGLKAEGCDDPADNCPVSFGTDVAGIPSWNGDGACFVFTAPDAVGGPETRVICEGSSGGSVIKDAAVPVADELGRSVAGIPVANDPVGVAFIGAPGASAQAGALYRLTDFAPTHTPVALPASIALAAGDRFGDAMAAGVDPATSDVLLAVTASGADRVYVLALRDEPAGLGVDLLACLDGGEGFGGALAFGDLTGEGDPELVVGEAADAVGRTDTVAVFALADLTGEAGCGIAPAPPVTTVTCPTGLGVECAGSGFGSSLAIGDVDADAVGDLLIGAPGATVEGEPNAGAAFLLSGSMAGLSTLGETKDVLVDSDPETNARLGTAVAMVGSHIGISAMERTEPVASVPGEGKLFYFLCSELETIASLADSRCLEL